jgi:hypothetical protein
LQDKWHYTSLEKIFFEEKIYKELEKKHETWEKVLDWPSPKLSNPSANSSNATSPGRISSN